MTHEKLVELTILAVTALANCVAAASIWILKRELKLQTKAFTDEYAWRRQELSIRTLKEWNVTTSVHRDHIECYFRKKYGHPARDRYLPHPITYDEAKAIYNYGAEDDELRSVRNDIVDLLDYFEYISEAYNKEALDRDIVDHSLKVPMLRWYSELQHFIDYVTEARNNKNPWQPYSDQVKRWQPAPPPGKGFGRTDDEFGAAEH